MHEARISPDPYSLEVTPNPRAEGYWQWSIRHRGKLVQRSTRPIAQEERARAQGVEQIERLQHGVDDRHR